MTRWNGVLIASEVLRQMTSYLQTLKWGVAEYVELGLPAVPRKHCFDSKYVAFWILKEPFVLLYFLLYFTADLICPG